MATLKKKPLYKSLYVQVIAAITIGVLLGHFYPQSGVAMKPLGDGFIKLIKMIIAPIIFCTIVTGIAGMDNMRQVGRVAFKAFVYFTVVTLFALTIGLVIVNGYQPGKGMNIDPTTLDSSEVDVYTSGAKKIAGFSEFALHVIPSSVVDAFAKGEILQVLFFSLLFAAALSMMGEKGKSITAGIEKFSHVLFGIVGLIMKVAPIGAFGAMAFTIGQYGIGSVAQLLKLMLGFYATCAIFVFVILGALMRMMRLSIWQLLKYIKEELFIVLGTSSSESVLPRIMDKMTELGCKKSVVGMVIPTGYSFNLSGTAIYLTMAAIFIAQATNTPMTLAEEIGLLGILLITSKGAAGVTGSGFIVLAATLSTTGNIPVAGLALILGIDRFMSEARAITNLISNAVATVAVAKWEGAFDEKRARDILSGKKIAQLDSDIKE
jgi:aerobic C4-dicarboxylate transport protein